MVPSPLRCGPPRPRALTPLLDVIVLVCKASDSDGEGNHKSQIMELTRTQWLPDGASTVCTKCAKHFSLTLRRVRAC